MIKGAVFTIGILVSLGGFGTAFLSAFADGMSDNPVEANADDTPRNAAIVGALGVAMIIGAFFIP